MTDQTGENTQTPAEGDVTVVNADGDGTPEPEEKSFTQRDVDEIVQKRLARESKKYKDLERKASIYDGMMQDPEVTGFLNNLASGKQSSNTPSKTEGGEKDQLIKELNELDPQVGGVVHKLLDIVSKETEERIGGRVAKTENEIAEEKARQRYEAMKTAKNEEGKPVYPFLEDPEFREDMATLMESGRAYMLEDAYDLAMVGRQRSGTLPKESPAKEKAELLPSDEGTGHLSTPDPTKNEDGSPRIFKSVEECVDTLAQQRGWFK